MQAAARGPPRRLLSSGALKPTFDEHFTPKRQILENVTAKITRVFGLFFSRLGVINYLTRCVELWVGGCLRVRERNRLAGRARAQQVHEAGGLAAFNEAARYREWTRSPHNSSGSGGSSNTSNPPPERSRGAASSSSSTDLSSTPSSARRISVGGSGSAEEFFLDGVSTE